MDNLSIGDIWSIISSIVSIILGFFAIFLSVYFFVVSRKSEKEVSQSLAKIETQAEMLQKITGKQMDRLTRYVTEERPNMADDTLPKIVTVLAELPLSITATLQRMAVPDNQEQLINEIITCYIALYFYTVQTNYWAQQFLPNLSEFNEDDINHITARRIVDMSNGDFNTIAQILSKVDPKKLEENAIAGLLIETRDAWKDYVKTCTEVYIERTRQNQK